MWTYPKFKIGDSVTTPNGKGVVSQVKWDGQNWYEVDGSWFSEKEIVPN
jgi:hypothetical protein